MAFGNAAPSCDSLKWLFQIKNCIVMKKKKPLDNMLEQVMSVFASPFYMFHAAW